MIPATSLSPDLGLVTTSVDATGTTTTTAYADPVSGLATASTVDPAGLALATTTSYEAPGSGAYRRRTARALPAVSTGANKTTTYVHYGQSGVSNTPAAVTCSDGSVTVTSVNQRGLPKLATSADPNTLGGTGGIVTETVHDATGRVVAPRYNSESTWACTEHDTRGQVIKRTVPAFGGQPARLVTTSHAVGGDPLLSSVADAAGTIKTRVDLLGRVTDTVDVWGVHTHTDYDQAGRTTQTTVFKSNLAVIERTMFDYATTGSGVNEITAQRWSAASATASGYNTVRDH